MELPLLPNCDSHGWFQPVLPPPSPNWPWALPHFYAVNVAPDPGEEIIGVSASPDGSYEARSGFLSGRAWFEVIGFWNGEYRLLHWNQTMTRDLAEKEAKNTFKTIAVRYLMRSGRVISENHKVEITGKWPTKWTVKTHQDIGVFCSFLYEQAKGNGGQSAADIFRNSITCASPVTEQLRVYILALEKAQVVLVPYLSSEIKIVLADVLRSARAWL